MVNRRNLNTYDENKEKIVRQKRKIHRCREHCKFLTDCISNDICPAFTRFTPQQLSLVNWSPRILHSKRIERVKRALAEQVQKLNSLSLTLSNMISSLTLFFPNMNISPFLKTCDREVRIRERTADVNRREKFKKLKKDKKFEKIYDIVEKVMIKKKNIHPNVDYPTGPMYHLMGFDTDFFTPIFVISRITGWSAHIMEQHAANKLIRPLASYKGSKHRKVMQLNQR